MAQIKLCMRLYIYYGLIFLLSLCMLIFLPMIGSTQDIGYNLPNTKIGWIVFIVTKSVVAVINVLIFHCFICQAKVNVKDDPNYVEANEILGKLKKEVKPRSPKQFFTKEYSVKGTTTFIFSALSVVALTNAILTFDAIAFISYLLTLIMGTVFGIIEMKKVELFWTEEYHEYALNFASEAVKYEVLSTIPDNTENALHKEISPDTGITEGDNI